MRAITSPLALSLAGACLGIATLLSPSAASAQRVIEVDFTPTRRAQIAVWLTREDGTYLQTLALTQSVALHGIGNRPGASQMNSGFRWPYGRREGVLPVWAHARASAPGAELFNRVIFQNRTSEGHASRSSSDFSRDDYFCLSFDSSASQRNALDAVSCASTFNSDKGRYVTAEDVTGGYLEPAESAPGVSAPLRLDRFSLYPPRRDIRRCDTPGCFDHADVDRYAADARRVMPEIDMVTVATPPGETPQHLMFTVPSEWANGTYYVVVEINVEGDYGPSHGPTQYPTPAQVSSGAANTQWDYWALNYGYPYRGQPSVVYRVPVEVGQSATTSVNVAEGYGSVSGQGSEGGTVHPMDGTIVNDPAASAGSGADRLRAGEGGSRVRVRSQSAEACQDNVNPSAIQGMAVTQFADRHNAHRYAHLAFRAPSDDTGIVQYQVRVSQEPITDGPSFDRARPANAASLEIEALQLPTEAAAGELIEVDFGGLAYETEYWVGIRALDDCNASSPIAVVAYTTPPVEFTTVSPCFVATAAYGTPMANEIGVLRRFRDRHLRSNPLGEALVDAYYESGPRVAAWVGESESRREAVRTMLAPLVWLLSE